MHIEELETFVVGNRPGEFGGEYFIFIKLVTNTGVVGYGEHYGATFGPDVVPVMIRDIAERHLIGNNPFEIERFWHRCLGSGFSHRPVSYTHMTPPTPIPGRTLWAAAY